MIYTNVYLCYETVFCEVFVDLCIFVHNEMIRHFSNKSTSKFLTLFSNLIIYEMEVALFIAFKEYVHRG